jgi:hypothetical protein
MPMLGLSTDLRAPQLTFPAASLSQAQALTFVYLFFPITLYNHKISHTANIYVEAHRAIQVAAFRSLSKPKVFGPCLHRPKNQTYTMPEVMSR